jgi:hypothetical protein
LAEARNDVTPLGGAFFLLIVCCTAKGAGGRPFRRAECRRCPADKTPTKKDFPGLSCGVQAGQPPTCWADTVAGKKLVRKPGGPSYQVWELLKEPAGGRSGGPLIEKRGKLIGIGSGRSDGRGYYTHLDEIYRFLKANEAGQVLLEPKD